MGGGGTRGPTANRVHEGRKGRPGCEHGSRAASELAAAAAMRSPRSIGTKPSNQGRPGCEHSSRAASELAAAASRSPRSIGTKPSNHHTKKGGTKYER